ncbi:MAG: trehalase family glycosidase [Cytophagales bacterium]|nr:trehalase family glycosidase [Cytophagales bacterium]
MKDLKITAQSVLEQNWREGYTVPSAKLYPFQWNWDSGFIALGWMHLEEEKAMQEMESLFSGQWSNGFLPHIVFHHADKFGDQYFPSAKYWDSRTSEFAPKNVATSGISQPPVHGYVLERMVEKFGMKDRLKALIGKTLKLHQYYYDYRDTLKNGLINITHNWETGLDNAPWWDEALQRISRDELAHVFIDRRDKKVVENSADTRPSDEEYKRYIWQLNALKDVHYESIPANYPYQMVELTTNAIFLASGDSLIRLGRQCRLDVSLLEKKVKQGKESFSKVLWNEEGYFSPMDIVNGQLIPGWGAASFTPLFAQLLNEEQQSIVFKHLKNILKYPAVPSFDPKHSLYHPMKYWRGPIWINMNYLIWQGLKAYGKTELANQLKGQVLALVEKYGFMEYFPVDPNAPTAYGGENFSWTASLVLDMLESD